MDILNKPLCRDDPFNPLVTAVTQMSCILVISHFFHLLLKPVGQPGPIAQILAGVVLGPSLLSRIRRVGEFFLQASSADYYQFFAHIFAIIFMFLIGLEMDISFSKRNFRQASAMAYGGVILSSILGAAFSPLFIKELQIHDRRVVFVIVVLVMLASTASPVVIRLVADMKLDTSDVGRLAVTSSLLSDMSCVLAYSTCVAFASWKGFGNTFLPLFLTVGLVVLNKHMAFWFNKWDRDRKYVRNTHMSVIIFLVFALSMIVESSGYSSTIPCFFVGLMFPREGKTARTLLLKLSYFVHNFILPIYFGFMGFQLDVNCLRSLPNAIVVIIMVVLNFGGKMVGSLAACRYLKMPQNEGLIFALVLSLKGHFDLRLLDADISSWTWWNQEIRTVLVAVVVLNSLIAGTAIAFIVKKEEKHMAHEQTSIELHDPEVELRILACVYSPMHTSGALGLISSLAASQKGLITPYLMHLVELPQKRQTNLMYHQLEQEGDQFSDEDDYGGNDVLEINDAVDTFSTETKIQISLSKAVSSFAAMYEDVCNSAEDKRVSIIFLPFHKHQRIDGKMETDKEGIRTTNHKVLRHAPCSVGILVDRTHTGFQQPHGSQSSVQHVATLFFGGPDDREALSSSKWISSHPQVNLTVIRFLQVASTDHNSSIQNSSFQDNEALLAMSIHETESQIDNTFVVDFYNRYIASGKAGYIEKHVSNGAQIVTILRELRDAYSLFIVGKGGRGDLSITSSLSDWEECPELGTVGDFLASSDFNPKGSILVVQKHKHSDDNLSSG